MDELLPKPVGWFLGIMAVLLLAMTLFAGFEHNRQLELEVKFRRVEKIAHARDVLNAAVACGHYDCKPLGTRCILTERGAMCLK